ncbi:LolA-related protein [Uliginosibacterium flavum]|uniref:LolA-related protein n=1 Tax=Uliginosibacterium flavum TaxID=1396831 RepID=A0ABV2TGQ0_9RHOO
MMPDLFRWSVALLISLFMASSQGAEWQVSELMQLLAQNKSGHAKFVEKKYIGIVEGAVESSGELFFTAPDKLEKRTLKPRTESITLEGSQLIIERPGKQRLSLNLQNYPEAAAFVESIRGTLAGDKTALEKVYKLSLSGNADKWQLILLPQFSRMSDLITRIRIIGSRADVSRIEFDLADGDRSEIIVTQMVQP